MLRSLFLYTLALTAPSFASFSCPAGTTPLERKDEVQLMKGCLDTDERLHGPFEVWSRPAKAVEGKAYRRTTKGQYANGAQTGTWSYWTIEGTKVDENVFP